MFKNKAKTRLKKWHKVAIIIAASAVVLALAVLAIIFGDDLFALFSQADGVKNFIRSAGGFGPLVFVALQILQVVIAPIPGQVVGIVGGYLFGWWGLLLSMIGSGVGYYIVFKIARRFGRPLAEKLFKKDSIKKFDYITESSGAFILFIIFLLPFFPDDMICYLAGLTKVPIKNLMAAAIGGRFPGFLVATLAGNGLDSHNMNLIIATTIGSLLLGAICYRHRDWLHRFAKSKNRIKFIKHNWRLSVGQTIIAALVTVVVFILLTAFAVLDF
ncbi:MAG: TVP38/TMEM64 family protein [Candidatus Nomurabacteria bacterium]|jgi:uncharacterized membrane protein YdjX (TVP38/TMEM64 family)|nr:TVP38/TMEM64 family protein [Candidatus Nomurabacteria bacterium]